MKNPYKGKALYYRLLILTLVVISLGFFGAFITSEVVYRGYEIESEQKIDLYSDFIESRLTAYDRVDTFIEKSVENEIRTMASYLLSEKHLFSDAYFIDKVIDYNVTTIAWVNDQGQTQAASDPIFYDYQIDENHILWDFFSGPETILVEPIRESFIFDNTPYKYGNFKDDNGFMLQIGIEVADYNAIFSELTLQAIITDIYNSSDILYAKFVNIDHVITAHSMSQLIGTNEVEEHLLEAIDDEKHISHTHVHTLEGIRAYSIVTPIYVEDRYIGVIDIGFDPDFVLPTLRTVNTVTFTFITLLTLIIYAVTIYGGRAKALIFESAFLDSGTKLYSKQALDFTLSETSLKQRMKQMSYIMMNIDNYRTLIGIHGNETIQSVISVVADRLKAAYDPKFIFRVTQDEFLILCQSQNHDYILQRLNDTKALLAADIIINDYKFNLQFTVAIIDQSNDMTYKEIYSNLNIVMREAKRTNKGGVLFYDEKLILKIKKQKAIEDKLKAVLSTDSDEALFAVYQPQILTSTNQIGGFEVLSRLTLDDYGFIPPPEFIRVAEENGLIQSLGSYILKQVAKFYRSMVEANIKPIPVSINVSMIEIMNKGFAKQFILDIDSLLLPHDFIQVEITETVLASNFEHLKNEFLVLRQSGIKVSIDDFGTGYSSLSYLKVAPIDFIKLDKTFIDELDTDQETYTLSEAVINITHMLGAKVIAEGVETERQVNKLNMMACDYIQGYYYSKPLKLKDIIEFIKQYPKNN